MSYPHLRYPSGTARTRMSYNRPRPAVGSRSRAICAIQRSSGNQFCAGPRHRSQQRRRLLRRARTRTDGMALALLPYVRVRAARSVGRSVRRPAARVGWLPLRRLRCVAACRLRRCAWRRGGRRAGWVGRRSAECQQQLYTSTPSLVTTPLSAALGSLCRARLSESHAGGPRAVARSRCEPSSAGTRRAAGRTAAGWHSQGGPPRGFPARPFRPTTAG